MKIVNPTSPETQALVPVFFGELNGRTQLLVNARDLHAFLEGSKDFSSWIKAQIKRARLRENEHFGVFT
jgi:anti-repressor protein